MKINVEVNIDDFMGYFGGGELDKVIADDVKAEVLKKVKRHPKYKALIDERVNALVDNL